MQPDVSVCKDWEPATSHVIKAFRFARTTLLQAASGQVDGALYFI